MVGGAALPIEESFTFRNPQKESLISKEYRGFPRALHIFRSGDVESTGGTKTGASVVFYLSQAK